MAEEYPFRRVGSKVNIAVHPRSALPPKPDKGQKFQMGGTILFASRTQFGYIEPQYGCAIVGRTHDSAANALFGVTRQAVLGFFFDHPDERFYQRQVVQASALPRLWARVPCRELARLVAGGILKRTIEGRQAYYQVNRDQLDFLLELHSLVRKTNGEWRVSFETSSGRSSGGFAWHSSTDRWLAGKRGPRAMWT